MKNAMIILAVLMTTIIGYGQRPIKDKVNAKKIAFISSELDLTEAQAQKFWPIYNAYQDEMEALRMALDFKFSPEMTDKQADELMDKMLDIRAKEIEVQRRYIIKMKTAIPSRKVAQLFRLEKEFKGMVISKIADRQKGKRQ
jgi:hypothetical protein